MPQIKLAISVFKSENFRDIPGGPVLRILLAMQGDSGSVADRRTAISHTKGQPSFGAELRSRRATTGVCMATHKIPQKRGEDPACTNEDLMQQINTINEHIL